MNAKLSGGSKDRSKATYTQKKQQKAFIKKGKHLMIRIFNKYSKKKKSTHEHSSKVKNLSLSDDDEDSSSDSDSN